MAKVAILLAGLFGLGCGTFPIGGAGNTPSLANLGQNNFLATLCATFQNRLPMCSSLGALPTGRSLERTFGGAGNVQSPLNLGSTPGQVNNILATICATLQNRLPICSSLGALPTGRSLERHGKGKDGKGGKDSSNDLLSGITDLLSLPGVDLLTQILNGVLGLAAAAAAGTAVAGAISTFFPTITTTKLAPIPSPVTDIGGFLASPTVSNLIQALLAGDVVGVLTNAAALAASLLFQQIQQGFPASR